MTDPQQDAAPMVRHFDEQIRDVTKKIVLMGSLAESMIDLATRILVERDESLAREVYAKEDEVNALQVEIDDEALRLTALHQPVARDVRFLFTATKIVTDLERIADQAKNIVQNASYVLAQPSLKPMVDLPIMAEIAQKMVRDALTAVVNRDVNIAERIIAEESKVDAFRDQVFRTLLTYMVADPGTIQRALSLILISRNIERIGDHATNIAEEAIYIVQGRDVRHAASQAAAAAARNAV
ncbi:MAG TPA: phosphate signaling complex protein PhoU [Tepidisphaeraceae bacterium]|nr:phosphate signaling complex protein PhoU [Tepidisphaeraceae bacterium]